MTLQQQLEEIKQRVEGFDKHICNVCSDLNKFTMSIPPQDSDTDMQAVKITRTDIPKLLKAVEVMLGALEEIQGFHGLRGSIADRAIAEVESIFGGGK